MVVLRVLVELAEHWDLIVAGRYSVPAAKPVLKSAGPGSMKLGIFIANRITLILDFRYPGLHVTGEATDVVAQVFNIINCMNNFTETTI